jgi:hypothetical protein
LNVKKETAVKNIVTRFLLSLSAATVAPTAILAQEGSGVSITDVCTKPEYSEQSAKLWAAVQSADKTEVYLAYLEACGASDLTAEYAAIAREIVVKRTANFTQMPNSSERIVWEDSNPNGFMSIYVY